jgi:light-regulated signal transduction histidine kinase (bacteriophytochrome)
MVSPFVAAGESDAAHDARLSASEHVCWRVVAIIRPHVLAARSRAIQKNYLVLGVLLVLPLAIGSWLVASATLSRQKAHNATKQAYAGLEAANKELEAFAYSVSHDLRAPLRSMDGFSQALLDDYSDKLDEQGRDYLKRVRAGAQRMGTLIEDLLKLSRIARHEMQREQVDLSALAGKIAAELKESEPSRDVVLSIQDGLVADGDERLLRVVLENLLGNAWKFTGKRAKAVIELGATEHEGQTAYFVRDNGAGFDMAYADKLFGAFQRLHSTSEFTGTGIGLATVQRIVHRHGGRVWAEGKVGEGATFFFTLTA